VLRAPKLLLPLAVLAVGGLWAAAPALAAPAPIAWCGNDVVSADRLPDAVAGSQIQVIYAIPSDGGDRFGAVASQIASDVNAIDDWWRRQDPTRAPRFDLFAFPGCPTRLGQLDLAFVRLAEPASTFLAEDDRLPRLAGALAPFVHPHKKHLVYYDGPVAFQRACGTGWSGPEREGGRFGFGAVWVQASPRCGTTLGVAGYLAVTAVHELIHQLGVLPDGAAHPCPGDPGHPCDSSIDVMYGLPKPYEELDRYVLDAGRDDYYGHGGGWWDAQDSPFLTRLDAPQVPLSVTLAGQAEGDVVASDLPGIACPPACSIPWDGGTTVRLDATVAEGERTRFVRWEGGCSGEETACTLRLDAATNVTALFGPAFFRLVLNVRGRGRIVAAGLGLSCATRCIERLPAGDRLALVARPTRGWRLARWTGACRGTGPCRITLGRDAAVGALFVRRTARG
jgi:hypothetical protein